MPDERQAAIDAHVDLSFGRGNVEVTWSYCGEGYSGDFLMYDQKDKPLLRAEITVEKNGTTDLFSYCTMAPVGTSPEKLHLFSRDLFAHLEDEQYPRNIIELWTWRTK